MKCVWCPEEREFQMITALKAHVKEHHKENYFGDDALDESIGTICHGLELWNADELALPIPDLPAKRPRKVGVF